MLRFVVIFILVSAFSINSVFAEFFARPQDPFKDVPSHHWAYRSVERLRRAGILEGWGTRFHGKRRFTRYEMAVVVARFLEKASEATGKRNLTLSNRADLTGLCDEFRKELSLLDNRYTALARDLLVTKKILGNLVAMVGINKVLIRSLSKGHDQLDDRVSTLE